jgi:hypothetical protein
VKNPLVVFVLFAVAAVAWCAVAVYAMRPSMTGERRVVSYDLSDDPQPGTTVEIPSTDVFGKRIDSSGEVLLIVSATCTGCQAKAIGDSPLLNEVGHPIVVVYPDAPETLREQFSENDRERLFFISDPSEAYSEQLNAIWSPRMYVVTDGRLVLLQSEPGQKLWKKEVK